MKCHRQKLGAYFIAVLVTVTSCSDIIEYSPYKAGVKTPDKDLNIKAINRIEEINNAEFKPFSIGLVGDSHTYYDYFEKQIKLLNTKNDIDFVVHLGDLTVSGIYREFIWFRDITAKLEHPLVTIIGNHDYLSNGSYMFQEMFGTTNFHFVFNDCLLIFMDNIIWEKNVQDPDFEWLEDVLQTGQNYSKRIVFSHIPPWSDQFNKGNEYYFNQLLERYNVDLSVHGHGHSYYYGNRYNKTPYLMIPSSQKGEVIFLDIKDADIDIRRENY
jgi:3',5'-cyclic-AMP phosphodiesterase